ncbi:MAG: hypothetical protein Q9227_000308 [Pyrenula ochraceoflavens]
MGRVCDYSDSSTIPSSGDFTALRHKVQDLEERLTSAAAVTNGAAATNKDIRNGMISPSTFPTAFFLDAEAFNRARLVIPRPNLPVPGDVLMLLGDPQEFQNLADKYFQTVHTWLPVVSKRRLYQQLHAPSAQSTADLALLFLCIKLLVHVPPDDDGTGSVDTIYQAAKQFFNAVESGGIMTLRLVQAAILISAYEVAHGIYPAAFLSTGHAARLSQTIGLHDRRRLMFALPGTWQGQEELRRVWWAVLILDRYVNFGSAGRPLASEIGPRDVLPSDDDLWDQGEMTTSEPMFVSSATNVRVGAFARTCQAAHLAGRVIQHRNDKSIDLRFQFAEALQLHRTISALYSVLPAEFEADPERMSMSMALCCSTQLALCDPYSCTEAHQGSNSVEETEMQAVAINAIQSVAEYVYTFSQHLSVSMSSNLDVINPFIAECIYQAAATKMWLVYENGTSEASQRLQSLKSTLHTINARWRIGGEYLKVLETWEASLFGDQGHSDAV